MKELIESNIELNGVDGDSTFNIYLCKETLNIFAEECSENPRTIQYRVKKFIANEFADLRKNNKFNINFIKKHFRYEILTYRLGRYTNDDEVTIGDIFMAGYYEKIGGIL